MDGVWVLTLRGACITLSAMAAAGKTIHDLEGKVNAIADVLFDAGCLKSCSVRSVAAAAEINYQTLKSALPQGRVSVEIEERLCVLGQFSAEDPTWRDGTQTATDRRKSPGQYNGSDTATAFRIMLRDKWFSPHRQYRALSDNVSVIDADLACHEFTDCQQSTTPPADILLFFEASFGAIWCDGVQYGLRTARVNLRFVEKGSGEFSIRFAKDGQQHIGDASIIFSGTSSLPCWEISQTSADQDLLNGVYRTTDTPFAAVTGYRDGTKLRSVLYANLNDSFVTLDPTVAISENQRAIIEVICAGVIPEERRRLGVIELCSQDITLTEVKHAEAA